MAELTVLDDNVLLIPRTVTQTEGGILLTKHQQDMEYKTTCNISVVGPKVKDPRLQEGVTVIIPRRTGKWVPFEGFKYILIKESDILCILDGVKVEKVVKEEKEDEHQ